MLFQFLRKIDTSLPADPVVTSPIAQEVVATSSTDLVIDYSGSKITMHQGGSIDVESTTVNISAGNVNVTGKVTAANIEATSELKGATALIGGRQFASHTHSGVQSGASNTGGVV